MSTLNIVLLVSGGLAALFSFCLILFRNFREGLGEFLLDILSAIGDGFSAIGDAIGDCDFGGGDGGGGDCGGGGD